MGRYNSDSNVQISDKAVEAGKNVISDIQKEKGRYPNFEDFINYNREFVNENPVCLQTNLDILQ